MRITESKIIFVLGLLLFISPHLFGQIKLSLEINHKNFHQYEPIFVRVTFVNRTGRFISFSDSAINKGGKLMFRIQDEKDNIMPLRQPGKLPEVNGLSLPNGGTEKMTYCLTKYYKIFKCGKYRVRAILEHPQVAKRWESISDVTFTVGVGETIMEQTVGVPDPDNGMKNKLRKYIMKTFYDGKDRIYYLIVEDDKFIYSVVRLGYDVGTAARPQYKIDALNRLHIILQASPLIFSHFVYNYTGQKESRQTYYKTDKSPVLVRDPKTGMVKVVGGRKAIKGVNFKDDDPGTIFGK